MDTEKERQSLEIQTMVSMVKNPNMLKGMIIERINQVWKTDST